MKQIAFFVGIAAVILYLVGYQQKTRKKIILFNATSRALYILQYLMLSAFEGAVLDIAGIISSLLAQKKNTPLIKKHLRLFIIAVNLFIVLLGLTTYKDIYSLLPIFGVLLHTSAFWITDEKRIRQVSLLGCPFWLIYNLISGAYGSVIGDALSIVSILIAMSRYDFKPTKNETKLLLIRHGESEANVKKVFAGHFDAPLVERGIKQADLAAIYIKNNYNPHKIYSSDLLRAYQTAERISKATGLKIIKEPQLREINAGDWEGKEFDKLADLFPDDFYVWNNDIGKTICTNGESVNGLGKRIISILEKIAKENEGKTVVVVTHATPVRVTQTILTTGSLEDMQKIPFVSNASLTEVIWKNGNLSLNKAGIDDYLCKLKTNSLA